MTERFYVVDGKGADRLGAPLLTKDAAEAARRALQAHEPTPTLLVIRRCEDKEGPDAA